MKIMVVNHSDDVITLVMILGIAMIMTKYGY